jgi:hypothetical protein
VHQAVAVLADLFMTRATPSLQVHPIQSPSVKVVQVVLLTHPMDHKVKTLSLMTRQPSAVVTVVKETMVIRKMVAPVDLAAAVVMMAAAVVVEQPNRDMAVVA